MRLTIIRFLNLLLTAVALGAGLAHLLALPNKIHLSRENYLVVQQVYRGWALLGIVDLGALISTFILAVMSRRKPRRFLWAVIALACIAGALITFFAFTYPTNQQTTNWTVLPANWQMLRQRWEYSHAVGACLYLIAFVSLLVSVLVKCETRLAVSNDRRPL